MEEIYRTIEGFSNYEVSNLGNVRNNITSRIMKQQLNQNGYKVITFQNKEMKKTYKIHRLVALAFLHNPMNKPLIDHIDNNKQNNNASNLRWATIAENRFNSKISSHNTSGNKGVVFEKNTNKWRARIECNKRIYCIGRFDTKEEAIVARVNKAKELFGEFINKCEKTPEQLELEELEKLDEELTRIMNG